MRHQDLHSNRIVGHSIASRMQRLLVNAFNSAGNRRGDVARCIYLLNLCSAGPGNCFISSAEVNR